MTPEQAVEYALGATPLATDTGPLTSRENVPASDQPLYEPLTAREQEVLALIAAGLSNRQIAGRIFVAQSTVKSYVNAIFRKLGVENRTRAAAEARRLGLISEWRDVHPSKYQITVPSLGRWQLGPWWMTRNQRRIA
jgi:ATP/maltotriose-dependent transcriptional regulator MalT